MNSTPHPKMTPSTLATRAPSAASRIRLSETCAALLLTLSLLAPSLQAAPAYPLIGLAVKDIRTSPPGVPMTDTHAHQFQMIYGGDTSSFVQEILPLANPATTPVIPYMGGYTTNIAPDGNDAQSDAYAMGVAMVKVGTLKWNITDPNATHFSVELETDENYPKPTGKIPIIARSTISTTIVWDSKDVNDDGDGFGTDQYDSWLRIGNELIQITNVNYNPATRLAYLTVDRGHHGTTADTHDSGDAVFTPVYVGDGTSGNSRFANGYPQSGGSVTRYAIDPGQPGARNLRVKVINGYLGQGYDGAWWDTFNQIYYNMCDAVGNPVFPAVVFNNGIKNPTPAIWNFGTQSPYSKTQFVLKLQSFTKGVRAGLGSNPIPYVLYANTYAMGSYNLGGEIGTETLTDSVTETDDDDLLDGACFEDSFMKPNSSDGTNYDLTVGASWVANLEKMIDAADNTRRIICMIGPAGSASQHFHTGETKYPEKLRYSYASYLMAVDEAWGGSTQDNPLTLGLPLFMHMVGATPYVVPLHGMFSKPIGKPKSSQINDLNFLRLDNTRVGKWIYQREFTSGFAVVHTAPATDADGPIGGKTITLPTPPAGKKWVDAYTGADVGATKWLARGDGLILVAQ